MTLLDKINALPSEVRSSKDTTLITANLSADTALVKTEIGKGRIIEVLGLNTANSFLDVIDNDPNFRHVKQLIANGWFDIGSEMARQAVDQFVPALLTQEQADALKAIAEREVPVDEFEVRKLCWSDNGQWMI